MSFENPINAKPLMGPQKQPLVRVRRKHTLSTQRTSVQTAAKVRYPPFVSNDMNGPIRTFVHGAANGRSEPEQDI